MYTQRRKNVSETEKVTVRLPRSFIEKVDFLVEMDDFSSRSEAIRTAVRDMLYYRVDLVAEKVEKMAEQEQKMARAKAVRDEYLKK
uniref:Transcriptional regulator, CopG family n=1 Tax=uncultured organism TaxID=155900 RepID=M1PV35_9ZZZZ|nr:transcriptional regulator, CopG family [uncultured organism]